MRAVQTPGIHEQVIPESQQRYTIAIPEGYTGETAVELVVLEGITHYETERFGPALQTAVSWIQAAWDESQ